MEEKKSYRPENLHYLKMLARQYPNVQAASTEIINLQAILNLPKGTEHFISDIHGEYEAFLHILNSCSGVVKEKPGAMCMSRIRLRPASLHQARQSSTYLKPNSLYWKGLSSSSKRG